jgi:hypothetical protein
MFRSFLQKRLHFQPIAEPFDPLVGRQALFPHPKAMTAFGAEMNFNGLYFSAQTAPIRLPA